ncbi:hypothetical protein QJS04_geneDACA002190 [Acorus gramineus]|uniref:Acyl-CoA-binding domain-containing protein n=1 Tax=Acorus gramineus TaxID=55184 RepID=A0AAV9A7S4_ACOGR|nr:hypothetical protein QJS04_geneDACA002190 [Acorus gramineus]
MNLMEENTNEAQTESSPKVPIAGSDVLVVGKKTFESRFAEVREENLRLKRDLDEMNSSNLDLLKELQLVHVQLTAEISRCFKLEISRKSWSPCIQLRRRSKRFGNRYPCRNKIWISLVPVLSSKTQLAFGSGLPTHLC